MYCENCGIELTNEDKFCPKCGNKVIKTDAIRNAQNDPVTLQNNEAKFVLKKKKKNVGILIIVAVVVIALIGCIFFMIANSKSNRIKKKLELAERYMDELEYEQALDLYMAVLDIEPANVDAYLGIVEVYIRQNDFDIALDYAKKGYEITGDERLKEKIDMIESGQIFDSLGRALKMSVYDDSGRLLWWHQYTYNMKGNQDTVTHFDKNGNQLGMVQLEYDEDGNELTSYGYIDTGELNKTICEYEKGQCISEKWYELDGELIFWEEYEYDSKGLEVKMKSYDADGQLYGCCTYEYDNQDRRIKELQYDFFDGKEEYAGYQSWEYEDDELVRYAQYDNNDNVEWYTLYEYDEDGNCLAEYEYDASGKLRWKQSYE